MSCATLPPGAHRYGGAGRAGSARPRWRRSTWRAVCRDAAAGIKTAKLRTKILSASTRSAVENLARADRAHAATTDQWDADSMVIGAPLITCNLPYISGAGFAAGNVFYNVEV
jgi:hypothetical protein